MYLMKYVKGFDELNILTTSSTFASIGKYNYNFIFSPDAFGLLCQVRFMIQINQQVDKFK